VVTAEHILEYIGLE